MACQYGQCYFLASGSDRRPKDQKEVQLNGKSKRKV